MALPNAKEAIVIGRDGEAGAILRSDVLAKTRRGIVHILESTEIRGHNVVVSIMRCGDVLAPEILTYPQRNEIHPFDYCRRCLRNKSKEQT
jgi:hypothetical protein